MHIQLTWVVLLHEVPRPFNFENYLHRPVALELFYLGKDYQGYARQDHTENTIEVARLSLRFLF